MKIRWWWMRVVRRVRCWLEENWPPGAGQRRRHGELVERHWEVVRDGLRHCAELRRIAAKLEARNVRRAALREEERLLVAARQSGILERASEEAARLRRGEGS